MKTRKTKSGSIIDMDATIVCERDSHKGIITVSYTHLDVYKRQMYVSMRTRYVLPAVHARECTQPTL